MDQTGGGTASRVHPNEPNLQALELSLSRGEADGLIYIEQLETAQNECQNPNRPYLLAVNNSQGVAIVFQPACKTWACPVCGPVNKRRWIARAIHGINAIRAENQPVGFLTLTSHEKLRGDASFRVFPAAWAKLRHRWYEQVASGDRFYMAVPERHKDGTLHTHLIISGKLPERWWKDNARACGMGYMADLQEVADLGVGGYVGKYLGKTLEEEWPKRKRRVNVSRSWPKLPPPAALPDWEFSKIDRKTPLNVQISNMERDGFDVVFASARGSWALVDEIERLSTDQQPD